MTTDETREVIRKIKSFRPFFQTGLSSTEHTRFVLDWHQVLEPYDFRDVDEALNKYFKNGDNIGKIPDVYYLTKFLQTSKEKSMVTKGCIICPLCRGIVSEEKFDEHYGRCLSVDFIARNTEKFYQRKVNRKPLIEMEKTEFDKKYLTFVKQIKELATEEKEKKLLSKMVILLEKIGGKDG